MVEKTGKERPRRDKEARQDEKKSGAARSKSKKEEKKAPATEDEPVLSGRMVLALALALAMIVIPTSNLRKYITKTAPRTTDRAAWNVGQTATLHITVVTSDYEHLACADKRMAGDAHCEWESEQQRWAQDPGAPVDDNKLHVLQPYRTTDKNLLLAPGLWAQPEVAMRVHNEPPRGVSKSKLARFVVSCEVKFLEEWPNAIVRWSPGESWSNQGTAMVGEIKHCEILEDQKS